MPFPELCTESKFSFPRSKLHDFHELPKGATNDQKERATKDGERSRQGHGSNLVLVQEAENVVHRALQLVVL